MDAERIQELRNLIEKATPLPWKMSVSVTACTEFSVSEKKTTSINVSFLGHAATPTLSGMSLDNVKEVVGHDRLLAEAAVNALPALLDAAERLEVAEKYLANAIQKAAENSLQSMTAKPCYGGGTCRNADLVEELNQRIAELEEHLKKYAVLDDPSKPEAVEAIRLYILRYFDAEKTQSLMRTFGFPQYVEMANRISELEALVEKGNYAIGENCELRKRIFEIENLLKGCGFEIIWSSEDDERPRVKRKDVLYYPERESE